MPSPRTLCLLLATACTVATDSTAQCPAITLDANIASAFNGSGPMLGATIIPLRIGSPGGLQLGVGAGGWAGRLSNDAYDEGYRRLYGAGPRAEVRLPFGGGRVAVAARVGVDWIKSDVRNAFFLIGPPAPGEIWDRSNGTGTGYGAELAVSFRISPRWSWHVVGGRAHQSLYDAGSNTMSRVGVGVAVES